MTTTMTDDRSGRADRLTQLAEWNTREANTHLDAARVARLWITSALAGHGVTGPDADAFLAAVDQLRSHEFDAGISQARATDQRLQAADLRAEQEAARACLRCGKDLGNVTGVMVFVMREGRFDRVPGLLCIEHGANGANTLSADEYARLTAAQEATL